MQELLETIPPTADFQYPPFGSSVCNGTCGWSSRGMLIFQYPPFGSSVCNDDSRARAAQSGLHPLSVSSIRIECLQPWTRLGTSWIMWRFQYPPFGSSVCNSGDDGPRGRKGVAFSILHSDRVSATASPDALSKRTRAFQYPPFGSSVCNPSCRPRRVATSSALSVSSIRIECLQQE